METSTIGNPVWDTFELLAMTPEKPNAYCLPLNTRIDILCNVFSLTVHRGTQTAFDVRSFELHQ